ncbi:Atu4866 domain-containing protein [Pseudoxanthobacter sp. M-2]|uniref:Atu4866 domain-containing protein n=1 Tax=Pseudoxanthobacter sp. M-2 TaxID=3078754 RepID=UPI0038FC2FDF
MTALRSLALAVATATAFALIPQSQAQMTTDPEASAAERQDHPKSQLQPHPYVGMWVTADGRIRHELLPNGRYDEARGSRESAYQGRYEVTGTEIFYWDDTGFTADGVFVDADTLHHGGMILTRRR